MLDLAELGSGTLLLNEPVAVLPSVRVRAARNLSGFPLPAGMSRDERCELERCEKVAFCEPFYTKTDVSTKTGPGQTQGKRSKRDAFVAGLSWKRWSS